MQFEGCADLRPLTRLIAIRLKRYIRLAISPSSLFRKRDPTQDQSLKLCIQTGLILRLIFLVKPSWSKCASPMCEPLVALFCRRSRDQACTMPEASVETTLLSIAASCPLSMRM